MLGPDQLHIGRQPRLDMGVVLRLAGGVDDEQQRAVLVRIGRARDHQVVEDATLLVQELRIALLAGRQVDDIGWDQRL